MQADRCTRIRSLEIGNTTVSIYLNWAGQLWLDSLPEFLPGYLPHKQSAGHWNQLVNATPNFNCRILNYARTSHWIISENGSTTTVQTELTATTFRKIKISYVHYIPFCRSTKWPTSYLHLQTHNWNSISKLCVANKVPHVLKIRQLDEPMYTTVYLRKNAQTLKWYSSKL